MTEEIPGLIAPQVPDLRPLAMLHRRHDGNIAFVRKENGAFVSLYGVPATDLEGVFPQLLPDLESDAYASVNGMKKPRGGTATHSPDGLALTIALRSNSVTRWITSAFADIDCYNRGISVGKAWGNVIDLQLQGVIPPVSMFQFSGQGLWCYWILRDRHDEATPKEWPADGPVRAWPEKVELWAAIQRRIGEKLADIGYDQGSRDAARVSRVAGSLHTKASVRVRYHIACDATGHMPIYTLDGLANHLGVRLKPKTRKVEDIDLEMARRGRKGAAGRWRYDKNRFRQLWTIRNSWPVGMRNKAAFVYATILGSLRGDERMTADQIREELVNLFHDFEQPVDDPYTLAELEAVVGQVTAESATRKKGVSRPLRHQTIADRLDVTPEESAVCGWPAASRFRLLPGVPKVGRSELAESRRNAIRGLLEALGGQIPTCREAVDYLAGVGLDTSPATILGDFKALGIDNPRTKSKRRRRCAQKQAPKLFPD
jgi:hypothetical protein